MKEGIHPKYVESTVICACGNTFKTRSTKPLIKLEICSNCHPFFSGREKLIDIAGNVEKFKSKYKKIELPTEKKKTEKKVSKKVKLSKRILTSTPQKASLKKTNIKKHREISARKEKTS